MKKYLAAAVGLAGVVGFSASSAALTTWNFAGNGGVMSSSETFFADDGTPIVANGFAVPFFNEDNVFESFIHQNSAGIGVCEIGFICAFPNLDAAPVIGYELFRFDLPSDQWEPVSMTLSGFGDLDGIVVLGGNLIDASDAVELASLTGDSGLDPQTLLLDAGGATFQHLFVAATIDPLVCTFTILGHCVLPHHTASSFRVLELQGENRQVPEPGALALLGAALVGVAFLRRRRG